MDKNTIWQQFDCLWNDLLPEDNFETRKPLLAHYTSISTAERIIVDEQIWFSNPLYMNDYEEVRFGMAQGLRAVMQSADLQAALVTDVRRIQFRTSFQKYYDLFANQHVLDTYVFCLSEHDVNDNDGLLSMWRGYGGSGSGVALVIDTSKLSPVVDSSLILARVSYGSPKERIEWIRKKVVDFAAILSSTNIPDEGLDVAAAAFFERLKLFAVFSKHRGFHEEREWRVVYLPTRDPEGKLKTMFGYLIGPRGLEPKLKFRLAPVDGVTSLEFSLGMILERILLGPTVSSPLAVSTFHRLLEVNDRGNLKDRVRASGIPFRHG